MSTPLPVLVGLDGQTLLPRERELLLRFRPRGVVLFKRNVDSLAQLRALCAEVETLLATESVLPLIAADQEGGPVSVLGRALGCPPSARALGLADDPELTRRVHRETARRARHAGVNFLLAPVADVNRPQNPVVGIRAFGEQSEEVAVHAAAAVRGLREGGVYACAKHWPGHGSPVRDSHREPTDLKLELQTWQKVDLPPFKATVRAGIEALMVGHLAFSQLDRSGTVAPLSRAILQEARTRLGFTGILVSDALEMAGFGGADPTHALRAGLDLLLYSRPLLEIEDGLHSLREALSGKAQPSVVSMGTLLAPPVAEDGEAYSEARRRGLHTQGQLRWNETSWVLWDGVSRDRLYPFPDLGPRGGSDADASQNTAETAMETSLSGVLNLPARQVFSWNPHALSGGGDPIPAESWPREGEGLILASLRPLPQALCEELATRTARGSWRPAWIVFLGLGLRGSLPPGEVPWTQLPGLCEEDFRLLPSLLTGQR